MTPSGHVNQAVLEFPFASVGIALSNGRVRAFDYLSGPRNAHRERVSGINAVVDAYRANPCTLIVPCQRVIAATGWVGCAVDRCGEKLVTKGWLLAHKDVL
jgi:hypothetical protein